MGDEERSRVLASIEDDLSGAYTEEGIRVWFTRPRVQLGGRSPADILSGDWDPASQDVAAVRQLARSLRGG